MKGQIQILLGVKMSKLYVYIKLYYIGLISVVIWVMLLFVDNYS